ncbi:MAG TPA: hypothetical protein VJQ52_16355 [Steroidobacteraceae bacterium]|nr:hypothetical protein [Steroidobacteraceae bacterium]
MLFKIKRALQLRSFNRGVRQVLHTPPVRHDPGSRVILVTQIYPPDLLMYLVAVKTFTQYVRVRQCHVVSDRLSDSDKATIREHVPGCHIVDLPEVDTGGFPRGGTWERLLHIIDLAQDAYVIQLDADTLTVAPPSEVLECIANNRSFTLGTWMGREITSARAAQEQLAKLNSSDPHVQTVAELALHQLDDENARYVRGNSAFAGFGAGQHDRAKLRRFSQRMATLIGEKKWNEWGSEQVASNFMVANAAGGYVLPFERYRYFSPLEAAEAKAAVLLHFIGTHRFAGGVYRDMSRAHLRGGLVTQS